MHLLSRSLRSVLASAAVLLLVVGTAGCGSDDKTDTAGGDDGGGSTTDDGGPDYGAGATGGDGEATPEAIVARDFSLSGITVGPGEEIKMKNTGGVPHTATADNGEFDLGEVAPGETSDPATAPEEPGAYPFHCEIHKDMTATLTVEA